MPVQLICTGFAKCGTTMMHEMFAQHSTMAVPRDRKEIKHFIECESNDPADYFRQFNDTGNEENTFEASPQYMTALTVQESRRIMERIKTTVPNPKILICLRHPLYRAFSHYIHNLQFFSRFGGQHKRPKDERDRFQTMYQRSFFEALTLEENIGTRYFEKCAAAVEIFGAENVRFFFLEYHGSDAVAYSKILNSILAAECAVDWEKFDRVYEGARFPRYHIAVDDELEISAGDLLVRMKNRSVYVANDVENILVRSLGKPKLQRLRRAQSAWTRGIEGKRAAEIHERLFRRDFDQTLALAATVTGDDSLLPYYENWQYKSKSVPFAEPEAESLKRLIEKRAAGSIISEA